VELSDALAFARTNRWSVLTTIRGSGLPQLSNVAHYVGGDGIIRISVTATRAKYYRALSGEHEDWDAYRAAMVADQRAVVRLTPDRAYGMLSLPGRGEAERE
jgi:hypothetical protein